MDHLKVDPIQTQREIWLRARVQLEERLKEQKAGEKRLQEAVDRAGERVVNEEAALDRLIAEAKTKFDTYKMLPQQPATPFQAQAVEMGGAFEEAEAPNKTPALDHVADEAGRLVPRREVALETANSAGQTSAAQ